MLPENEYYSFENRNYINPQVSLDEQNRFIDNLRNVQAQKNQQITTQTYNLGSALPSNLGGLIGGGGYWRSRYQTPQTNMLVNDLRTAAQSKALSDILANEQAKMQKRYNAAYRASQVRSSNGGGGNGGTEKPKLPADTNDGSGSTTEVDQITEYKKGNYYPVTDKLGDYYDTSGNWWLVSEPSFRDITFGPAVNALNSASTNEKVITVNGQDYMYLDSIPNTAPSWYKVTHSAGPGTYSY